ncbi:MAG: hypothetical protein ACI9WU_005189, partial [Myxococcota bacterium]
MGRRTQKKRTANPLRIVANTAFRMITGVVGGIVLLLAAFFVLVWSEARVNLAAAIAHATHMNDEHPTVAGEAVTL